MLIAVFSDSHGNVDNMISSVEKYRPDTIIHLGDCTADADALRARFPHIPMYALRGNCDWADTDHPEDLLTELDGVRIFAAHGHRHHVKFGLSAFLNSVAFSGSALGLYGHTHRPRWDEKNGLQVMNPGSAGDGRSPTFGIIETNSGSFTCKIVDIKD